MEGEPRFDDPAPQKIAHIVFLGDDHGCTRPIVGAFIL